MRPVSIIQFERCYLGAILIGLVNSLFLTPAMLRTPQMAQATATLGAGFVYVSLLLGLAITLLLLWLAGRRASVVAKWIIVVFFAFGVLGIVRRVGTGFPTPVAGVLGVVAFVLQALAVYLLFRPDSNRWFASRSDLGETLR